MADGLGVELVEYHCMIDDVSSTNLLSLDELAGGGDDNKPVPLVDTLRSSNQPCAMNLEREELRDLPADSLGRLSEQERLIVALYYYEE